MTITHAPAGGMTLPACRRWTSGGAPSTVVTVTAVISLLLTGCGEHRADPRKAAIRACDTLAGFAARSACWADAIRKREAGTP